MLESHVSTRSGASSRQKAYSAPVPLELGKDQNLHEMEGDVDAIDLGPAGMVCQTFFAIKSQQCMPRELY